MFRAFHNWLFKEMVPSLLIDYLKGTGTSADTKDLFHSKGHVILYSALPNLCEPFNFSFILLQVTRYFKHQCFPISVGFQARHEPKFMNSQVLTNRVADKANAAHSL